MGPIFWTCAGLLIATFALLVAAAIGRPVPIAPGWGARLFGLLALELLAVTVWGLAPPREAPPEAAATAALTAEEVAVETHDAALLESARSLALAGDYAGAEQAFVSAIPALERAGDPVDLADALLLEADWRERYATTSGDPRVLYERVLAICPEDVAACQLRRGRVYLAGGRHLQAEYDDLQDIRYQRAWALYDKARAAGLVTQALVQQARMLHFERKRARALGDGDAFFTHRDALLEEAQAAAPTSALSPTDRARLFRMLGKSLEFQPASLEKGFRRDRETYEEIRRWYEDAVESCGPDRVCAAEGWLVIGHLERDMVKMTAASGDTEEHFERMIAAYAEAVDRFPSAGLAGPYGRRGKALRGLARGHRDAGDYRAAARFFDESARAFAMSHVQRDREVHAVNARKDWAKAWARVPAG